MQKRTCEPESVRGDIQLKNSLVLAERGWELGQQIVAEVNDLKASEGGKVQFLLLL